MTERVELGDVIRALLRRWPVLLVFTIAGAAAGLGYTTLVVPVYQATTSILVGGSTEASDTTSEDIVTSQGLATTYADLARREPVLQGAIDELRLPGTWEQLQRRVRVSLPPNNLQLVVIAAEAGSPERAIAIAEEVANQLIALGPRSRDSTVEFVRDRLEVLQDNIKTREARIAELQASLPSATETEQNTIQSRIAQLQALIISWQGNYTALLEFLDRQGSANTLQVIESAHADPTPVRPDRKMNVILGAGLGLLLGSLLAYWLAFRPGASEPARAETTGTDRTEGSDAASPRLIVAGDLRRSGSEDGG
jgi:capsular polysaccharide biosynthesis protein